MTIVNAMMVDVVHGNVGKGGNCMVGSCNCNDGSNGNRTKFN